MPKRKLGKSNLEVAIGLGCMGKSFSPKADVSVVQLSLDQRQAPAAHYQLGRELRALRKKGVLILGSGVRAPKAP